MIQTTEGLDAAYAKISLLADNAWHYNNGDPYILAHQNIWMIECALRDPCDRTGIPRSVLDTIPSSRLAQYGTYFYNDDREKQYWQEEYDKLSIEEKIDIQGCFFPEQIEKLFSIFVDPSLKIAELKQRYREALFGREFVHRSTLTEAILTASEEYSRDYSCHLRKAQSEYYMKTIPYPAPRGTATTFAELVLQMQLHSEEIRSLWPPNNQRILNANVPEFYPKYSYEHAAIFRETTKSDYENVLVPSLMPWLDHGYPLRAFDFHEIDALSAEFQSLFLYDKMRRHSPPPSRRSVPFPPPDSPSIAENNHPFAPLTTNRSSPSVMMNSEQHSESALSISKNPPQVRRLYSAVLQNQMDIAKTDLAKTPSVEELEELEREALEQYRPSEESLTKASNDSISSDKFQELERLAMEQYNSGSATSVEAGNEFTPLHEPPCGGRLTPSYAALLVANSKLAGFYRSLARSWLLANLYARFR